MTIRLVISLFAMLGLASCTSETEPAATDHSGNWVLDPSRSSWSDGSFPPAMSIKINMRFDEDGVVYSSVNDTCQTSPADVMPGWCAYSAEPYRVNFTGRFDQTVLPVENQSRYNQVTVRRFNANEFQILKMKDGDLILAEFWTFRDNGQELVRRGVSLKANRTYDEYFRRQ